MFPGKPDTSIRHGRGKGRQMLNDGCCGEVGTQDFTKKSSSKRALQSCMHKPNISNPDFNDINIDGHPSFLQLVLLFEDG